MAPRHMHLNVFSTFGGYNQSGWRVSDLSPDEMYDLDYYVAMAKACEAAKLDSLFVAETSYFDGSSLRVCPHDACTLASVLVGATEHLGFIATASTTLNEPFGVARRFSSMDRLSGGRVAWNIVTSFNEAEMANYGIEGLPDHDERYRRGDEFVNIVKQLWDSWDADALVSDKATGVLVDPERVHPINHDGEHYRVRGPFTQPRSPQGWPVLVQAGSSKAGTEFAARHAEVVFTVQPILKDAIAWRTKLRELAVEAGRDPDTVKVLPGLLPVMGRTTEEADQRMAQLASMADTTQARNELVSMAGVDLSPYDLDDPLPIDLLDHTEGHQARTKIFADMVRGGNMTLRKVLARLAVATGHHASVGTYEQIADEMQEWFEAGACDGFNVQPPSMPGDLTLFLDNVVPILQERGLFRTEYKGTTFRDRLGLRAPAAPDRAVSSSL